MIPIWRVCWARIADTVLTTRNPDTINASAPMNPSTRKKPWSRSLAGWRPGTGTYEPKTGMPARWTRVETSSATVRIPSWSSVESLALMRSSSKVVSKPRSWSVSGVTCPATRPA